MYQYRTTISGFDREKIVPNISLPGNFSFTLRLSAGEKIVPGNSGFWCAVQKLYAAVMPIVPGLTCSYYISRMQGTNSLLHRSHPDPEGTKGPLTGKLFQSF